ncbi:MAG: hypothetical protein M3O91_01370 [Chloroflexota bacterium]|nr:hypothetical protein [Chloroflexota bacterium]
MEWHEVPRLDAAEVARRMAAGDPVTIVDVRRETARRRGHVAGDLSHPRRRHQEMKDELPRDRMLVLY